jgi:hypothetical protein
LDEAESPSAIIDLISNTESATPIKILVVSRHTKDLSVALKMVQWPVYHEEIQTSDIAEDIHSYVAANIHQTLEDDPHGYVIIENINDCYITVINSH